MLRTMELILGLPPMTQYDAGATPMWRCFDTIAQSFSYKALVPDVDLTQKILFARSGKEDQNCLTMQKKMPTMILSLIVYYGMG